MPLKLDVERELVGRSERVKCVDIHPTEKWILSALYNGNVFIWNYDTETIDRTFEVSEVPVRCAKFVARKNWLVVGSDDMYIRVYNYNTCEKVKEIEAHTDYIRALCVHPTLPFVLSASDDMSIKLWDWDNNWENSVIFEGHTHYVMQVEINPKDTNSFASASLDRTVKIWGLNSSVPHFQLEGHERGVNCISYYQGGERPFLVSGADDNLIKVWDYQTKTCVATLEGHSANISAVMFHPALPIIISGSEDGSIKIWHSNTYRLETTLQYGLERVWTMASIQTSNKIAIGFDEGSIVIKLGQEEPVASMDASGKVLWARNHEIELTNVMRVSKKSLVDGDALALAPESLESCEFYPSMIKHNKNGQLVAMCGDGEYTIKTALRAKTKSYGTGLEFVWCSQEANVYAIRQSGAKVKIIRNFKDSESVSIRPSYSISAIFGGYLLGVKSSEFLDFYDWNDGRLIRRIEISGVKNVHWSDSGAVVVLVCDDNYFVLNYKQDYVDACIANNAVVNEEEGFPDAFELESDKSEVVTSGIFSGDIFLYTTSSRINYYIGKTVITLAHLDKAYYALGYIPRENRMYLIDKRYNIVSYELIRYTLAYQAAVVRGELAKAESLIKKGKIPADQFNKMALFLENQGKPEMALAVTQDCEHKFELALSLKKLRLAKEILLENETEQKWKQLAALALNELDFITMEECAMKAKDLSMLLLLYSSTNNKEGLLTVSKMAVRKGRLDIAFNVMFILGRVDECIKMLMEDEENLPQAALMARSYHPKDLKLIINSWKMSLNQISPAAAKSLGDLTSDPECFPDENLSSLNDILSAGAAAPVAAAAAAAVSGAAAAVAAVTAVGAVAAVAEEVGTNLSNGLNGLEYTEEKQDNAAAAEDDLEADVADVADEDDVGAEENNNNNNDAVTEDATLDTSDLLENFDDVSDKKPSGAAAASEDKVSKDDDELSVPSGLDDDAGDAEVADDDTNELNLDDDLDFDM